MIKHFSEFYPQDGGKNRLEGVLRHCQPYVYFSGTAVVLW